MASSEQAFACILGDGSVVTWGSPEPGLRVGLGIYTFGDNITHSKTKSVHFLGLMNSATKGWKGYEFVELLFWLLG